MNKTTIVEQAKDNTNGKPTKRMRDDKPRKKDEKNVDHVLRALDGFETTEAKLGAMCQKYAEMFNDHRMLQSAIKQAEKKNTLLQKEKEQLQAEHSKAILTRSRLENLCRELQRQNKAVKEECMLKMREEGEKKREVAAKFHSMLSEIGSLLAQNNDKNAKLRDDNLDMSMRLKSVCDQFEKKEQHVENLAKQMQLEMQLADAKLAKAKMEMDIEKETLQKEKQQLLIELADYKKKLCEMKASEIALREQITMYSEKYEEFHSALLQSNSAIGNFKSEMEKMTKHIRRLEKETATWKSRYDAAQRTLSEVTQGKIRADEALALSQRRLVALQGICRGLQNQCRQLRGEQRRDSQTDEEYKKLEAQIKEVEQNCIRDELDSRPCPRRVSCEESNCGTGESQPSESEEADAGEPSDQNFSKSTDLQEIQFDENTIKTVEEDKSSSVSNMSLGGQEAVVDLKEKSKTEEMQKTEGIETCEILAPKSKGTTELDVSVPIVEKVEFVKTNKTEEKSHLISDHLTINDNHKSNSIEECVDSFVNHVQNDGDQSNLESCNDINSSVNEAIEQAQNTESLKETNIPILPNNAVVSTTLEQTPMLSNNVEHIPVSDSIGNEPPSVKSNNDETSTNTEENEGQQIPINQENDKITCIPEDNSQTKNKKKRKSKK